MVDHTLPPSLECAPLDNCWPQSYAWAIEQMPCPAYCCLPDGSIIHRNGAADRLWGPHCPDDRWDGFDRLLDLDNQSLRKSAHPVALASAGKSPAPTELFALCHNGQLRRVVLHAKPIFDPQGRPIGALCCLTDVSDKRRLEERARDNARSREQFISMLAHELRNPLSPIMNIASMLQQACAPKIVQLAGVVERQTKMLARFIADLLDAARLDLPLALPIQLVDCSVADVLALTLDACEPEILSRRQSLVLDAPRRDARLLCDPQRLAQALGNILRNASAFSRDGQEIVLRLLIQNERLLAEVCDHGQGIAAEDLPHVFAPFQRRRVAPGRAPVGAGLGLAIAKGVCEAHHGSIHVRSPGLGLGATVSLDLPIVQPEALSIPHPSLASP